jgi:hypothetical protein
LIQPEQREEIEGARTKQWGGTSPHRAERLTQPAPDF